MNATADTAPQPLPPLREDLVLMVAADNADGSPAWMIQDPVTNRFCRIGWLEFEMLVRWQSNADRLLQQVRDETPLHPDEDTVKGLTQFLERNYLLRADTEDASERLAAQAANSRRRNMRWLLHNYLFVRLPLVRPERFLSAILPYIGFVYRPGFAVLMALLTVLGVVLASREWDVFLSSLQSSFTPAGMLAYMAALAFAKVLHELGHALTATRYGVRVAHMGVSLVVMFPMLYTDTSESWKLTDRRKRLAIVSAGMVAEIGLAGLATLFWSLTPDGPIRSALFFLATTSWILTLAINASPFMRFDGYFLLSDYLDFPNLHVRSFAFGRRALRRWVLGWNDPLPEALSPQMARFLTVFAFIVWLVRLAVFAGIAVGVYLFFFKALGIFLFIVEIAWFIVMPVWSELKVWWLRRAEIRSGRRLVIFGLLALLALPVLVPLPHGISAQGWVRAANSLVVYSPYPAQVRYIHPGGPVSKGDLILALDSPDTNARREQAAAATATLWSQLQRSIVSDDELSQRTLLGSRLRREQAEGRSAEDDARRLELYAPFSGLVTDTDPLVHAGVWVNTQQPLSQVYQSDVWVAEVFVTPQQLAYLKVGDRAKVWLVHSPAPLEGSVLAIDRVRTQYLPDPMLNAEHGGSIAVSRVGDKSEVQHALYRVSLRLKQQPAVQATQLAKVVILGEPYSLGAQWARSLAGVLLRESGF